MSVDMNNLGAAGIRERQLAEARDAGRKASELEDGGDSKSARARPTDVQLSSEAQSLARLSETDNSTSFDGERVEAIKQAISEGRYHIDPVRLAEKFIDLEIELNQ